MLVGLVKQALHKLEIVLFQHVLFVVLVFHEVGELLLEVVEEHRVLVDVLKEELPCRLTVLVKLDLAVRGVQVEEGVKGVVVDLLPRLDRLCH